MMTNKRVRKSSSETKYTDIELAIEFNKLFGNMRILAQECAIITRDSSVADKSMALSNIIKRFHNINSKITKLKDLPRYGIVEEVYRKGLPEVKNCTVNISALEFQIINRSSPRNNLSSPQ